MNKIKSIIETWICLASANPEHLTSKEHKYFLNGLALLCLTGFTALIWGLNIVEWIL
jgi:hypothetical protein